MILKIQSITDIISNSSSEIFCYISSDDQDFIKNVFGDIDDLCGYNQESEITPCVWLSDQKDDEFPYREYHNDYDDEDDYYGRDKNHHKEKNENPNLAVVIELPYSHNRFKAFYKEGLLGFLKDKYKEKDIEKDDFDVVMCNGKY